MSFKVLVIPEDPTHNGYILKPVIEAVLEDAGKPHAFVHVLTNPRLQGYDHALQAIRGELYDKYRMMNVWIFLPDADRAKPHAMRQLEAELAQREINLLCCPIEPEVEILACVGRSDRLGIDWQAARQHPSFKEVVFDPFLSVHGDSRSAGGGRMELTVEGLTPRQRFYQLMRELAVLRDRIKRLIQP